MRIIVLKKRPSPEDSQEFGLGRVEAAKGQVISDGGKLSDEYVKRVIKESKPATLTKIKLTHEEKIEELKELIQKLKTDLKKAEKELRELRKESKTLTKPNGKTK